MDVRFSENNENTKCTLFVRLPIVLLVKAYNIITAYANFQL